MNKFIILTVPVFDIGTASVINEKVYIDKEMISEIVPSSLACRDVHLSGSKNGWNTLIIMNNGNRYRVIEDTEQISKLISAE